MIKQFFLNPRYVLFFALIIVMASCNNGNVDKATTGANTTSSPAIDDATVSKLTGLNDTIYILWTDTTEFKKLKGKVVFANTISKNSIITLAGWKTKGAREDSFDLVPDIILNKDKPSSSLTYGQDSYFGNLVLKGQDVQTIKDIYRTLDAKYVMFVPALVDGHIKYTLYPSITNSFAYADSAKLVGGITANPSPPKNY